jgi:hypothetical protein
MEGSGSLPLSNVSGYESYGSGTLVLHTLFIHSRNVFLIYETIVVEIAGSGSKGRGKKDRDPLGHLVVLIVITFAWPLDAKHTASRAHPCPHCWRLFANNNSLQSHISRQHRNPV